MAQVEDLILSKLDKMEASQDTFRESVNGKLSSIDLRLFSVERDVKDLGSRLNGVDGCAGELAGEAEELDDRLRVLEEEREAEGEALEEKKRVLDKWKIIAGTAVIGLVADLVLNLLRVVFKW